LDDSHIFCNDETIFPRSFRRFQHTFVNAEQDFVYHCRKIPCFDFGAHENFVSVRCHLQNGVLVVHPLEGQTGGGQWEEQAGHFWPSASGLSPISVSPLLKCLAQRLTALTSAVCSPMYTVQVHMNVCSYGTVFFGGKEFSHHSLDL
jgi:hypothetical protein